MLVEEVRFYSRRDRLGGTLMLPAGATEASPVPGVVQGPGWLGLRDSRLYAPYHEALVNAGVAVLVFDYRGFGDSEGDPTFLDMSAQVEDWRAALSYLETRAEIASDSLGVFGSGGTGGGHAIVVAGIDDRVRACVSQVPIADGRDWVRRARSEHEWLSFLERLGDDRKRSARTGVSELVAPRGDIVPPTAERKLTTVKNDVDKRVPELVRLASADTLLSYRPLDFAPRISPRALMVICVEGDTVTPEDHAQELFTKAGPPKRLVVQTLTSHYGAYGQYRDVICSLIVEWFRRYLRPRGTSVLTADEEDSIVSLTPDSAGATAGT